MTHKCLDDLLMVQRGLRQQRWLVFIVDSLLLGGGIAWVILFFSCIRPVPAWIAAISGIGTTIIMFAWFNRKRAINLNDAGLYLDRTFRLKERMSAVAALDNGISVFSTALLDDAEDCMRSLRDTPFIQNMIPPRTSYLAIPGAAIIALLLLTPTILPQDKPRIPTPHIATPIAAPSTNTAPDNRLQQLLSQLREANARLSKTHSAADQARVQRLQQELYKEISRLRQSGRLAGKPQARPKKLSSRHGQAPCELKIKDTVSPSAKNHVKAAKPAISGIPEAPDWAALPMIEAAIPASMHSGIRAYMNAITKDKLLPANLNFGNEPEGNKLDRQ